MTVVMKADEGGRDSAGDDEDKEWQRKKENDDDGEDSTHVMKGDRYSIMRIKYKLNYDRKKNSWDVNIRGHE